MVRASLRWIKLGFFPSPLVGEGGIGGRRPPYLEKDADALHRLWPRSGGETDKGSVSAERTPHPPPLRYGIFSHKGRREEPNLIQRNDARAICAHPGPLELPKGAVR